MESLTEEQKRRIELNRRKALEIRARKIAEAATIVNAATPSNIVPANAVNNRPNVPTKALPLTFGGSTNNKSFSSLSSASTASSSKTLTTASNPQKLLPSFAHNNYQPNKSSSNNSSSPPKRLPSFAQDSTSSRPQNSAPRRPTQSGKCVLLSRTTFRVVAGFNSKMINIFKTIPTHTYETTTRHWTFSLNYHFELMKALSTISEEVSISPLPDFVIKLMKQIPKESAKENIDMTALDSKLERALLPFQREGVLTAIQRNGRLMFADDMGLGKTIQAIASATYYRDEWPLLIVCPSSMRFAWRESILQWMPSLRSEEILVLITGKDQIGSEQVIICSYDLMSRRESELLMCKYQVVIFDESHFLKSSNSARSKAGQRLASLAKRVFLLSGTPALSRPIELYPQLKCLGLRGLPKLHEYGVRYCAAKETPWGWDYTGSANMEELNFILKECVMVRRLKSEVLSQLPAKRRQMVVLDKSLINTQDKVLKHMSQEMSRTNLKGGEKQGVLLTYFRETARSKLKAVTKFIEDLVEGEQKFLVFGHHKVMLDAITETLDKHKVQHIRIDGSTSSESRQVMCDRFQVDAQCKVAVLSITAANAGLTLSAASLVVFAELFWNPGILTQAEDRVHRIGQQNSVLVKYLVAQNTADDALWPLVQQKLNILNQAGLSKDNFYDADMEYSSGSSEQRRGEQGSRQSTLQEFFNDEDDEFWASLQISEVDGSIVEGPTPSTSTNGKSSRGRKRKL